MTFESLSSDAIDALLTATPPQRTSVNLTCECGTRLDNGYCRNEDCPHDRDDRVYVECEWCGWCPDPDNCVWRHECPKCGAAPSTQCTRQGGLDPLHSERWALVANGG